MYIMTLGVYAPHRSRGIGSRLLAHSLNEASEDENIVDAYLHVQTNNEEAIKFYCDPGGKFAFEKGEVIEKYYNCLLYTSPSPRDLSTSRMPSSA